MLHWQCLESFRHLDNLAAGIVEHQRGKGLLQGIYGGAELRAKRFFGDMLDDYAHDPVLRNDLGVLALWRPGGAPEIELVALHLGFARTALAQGADADWIAARLERACQELGSAVRRLDVNRFAIDG